MSAFGRWFVRSFSHRHTEIKRYIYSLIHELRSNTERSAHGVEGEGSVGLEELRVGSDSHLSDVVSSMRGEDSGGNEMVLFDGGCTQEEGDGRGGR